MNYYLEDSNSVYYQLGITTIGQIITTVVGAQTIVNLILEDSGSNYWQLGVSTIGQVITTSIGATSITSIILFDGIGVKWTIGVDTLGQLTATPSVIHQGYGAAGTSDYQWMGGEGNF